jgi:predicted amidohydrolase YtcJ
MLSCYPRTLASNDGVQNIADTYGVKVANTFVQPIKSLLDAGVRVSFESDNGTSNKWSDLSYFIIRKDMKGRLWGPQDRVDHPTALKLFTIYAADYVMKLDQLGSLEVGKLADLAVLNKDFLTIPDEEVPTVLSDLTIMDGKIRYVSPDFSNQYNLKPSGAVIDTFKNLAEKSRTSGAVGQ